MSASDDVHVVVRAAGERTEAACARLAAGQVGEANVTVIHEVPFSKAVRRGFEVGVAAGRAWTLCLDADVLLRPGAVAALTGAGDAALREDADLFGVSGKVADKLLGHVRTAGQHLYRTTLCAEALSGADFNARKRRPESTVKRHMQRAGHHWRDTEVPMGLHDFEQSFRDIYRKVYTHTRKHERFMGYAERYWLRAAQADPDLRVAYWSARVADALSRGMPPVEVRTDENVAIDVRRFPDDLSVLLVPTGMEEKPPLAEGSPTETEVERMLAAFEPAPEYERESAILAAHFDGPRARFLASLRSKGVSGTARRHLSRLLARTAAAID